MIAALPMYDLPAIRASTDRLWEAIRDRLREVGLPAPDSLTREVEDLWQIWQAPDLVLAQTCGFPYRARLHDRVTLVGTPDYAIDGCPPGHYRSVLLVRQDDPRSSLAELAGAPLAFNEAMSQSGWAAPCNDALTLGLRLRPGLETGSHAASARAVAEGRADWAALDPVTWRLLNRHEDFAARLRVAATTTPTPGLPFITCKGGDRARIRRACTDAITALAPADRNALGLRRLVTIPAPTYLAVPIPPAP